MKRLQNWSLSSDVILTCFSLPLVKHGDRVLRTLFHLSSLRLVMASSRGPVNVFSCDDEKRGDFGKCVEPFYVTLLHPMSPICEHAVARI